jgi:hypothetical protein
MPPDLDHQAFAPKRVGESRDLLDNAGDPRMNAYTMSALRLGNFLSNVNRVPSANTRQGIRRDGNADLFRRVGPLEIPVQKARVFFSLKADADEFWRNQQMFLFVKGPRDKIQVSSKRQEIITRLEL